MDLRNIFSFFAVVEHGNLSAAAQALRVSQPTLTRQMQALEAEFGATLFIRNSRGVALSEAGARLHEGLLGVARQIKSLRSDVTATLSEPTGEVSFGIPPSPRTLLGVTLMQRFATNCPQVVMRIVEETSGEIRDQVANGVLDMAVTNAFESVRGLLAEPLGREPMLLIGGPSSKLAMHSPVSFAQVGSFPLILTAAPNSLRLSVEARLRQRGQRPNIRIEADTLPLITDLVRAGLGYTVLPASGVRHLLKAKALKAAPINDFTITWLFVISKSRPLSIAAERFRDVLRETARELVANGTWHSAD